MSDDAWTRPPEAPDGRYAPPGGHDAFGQQQPPSQPPPFQQPPYHQPERPTSGLAIAALVTGIIGIVPAAVITGVMALRRIGRGRESGRGMAIAGLVLAAVWTVGFAGLVVIGATTGADRDERSGEIADGGTLSVFEIRRGDCMNGIEEASRVLTVDSVPCDRPHEAQTYATFELDDPEFPGQEQVNEESEEGCSARVEENAPSVADDDDAGVFYFNPTEQSWEQRDDRVIICMVVFDRPRTGSVLGR